jgi:hypothetical protein
LTQRLTSFIPPYKTENIASMGEFALECPHAEAMKAIFKLFPDVPKPSYADSPEEAKLKGMLREVLQKFQLT